jgi:hypothetical protein
LSTNELAYVIKINDEVNTTEADQTGISGKFNDSIDYVQHGNFGLTPAEFIPVKKLPIDKQAHLLNMNDEVNSEEFDQTNTSSSSKMNLAMLKRHVKLGKNQSMSKEESESISFTETLDSFSVITETSEGLDGEANLNVFIGTNYCSKPKVKAIIDGEDSYQATGSPNDSNSMLMLKSYLIDLLMTEATTPFWSFCPQKKNEDEE